MVTNHKGFTLIEILVAMSIFSVIIAAPTGFFVSSLKSQKRALASQELLDNTSYALEYISRALRMAKKDLEENCLNPIGSRYNYENPDSQIDRIRFVNYQDQCQEFFLEGGRLKESKAGMENYLTSDDLEIVSLQFKLSGQFQEDNLQPRVTLVLEIKGARGQKPELQPELKIQTTISQRNLDVVY